MNSDNKFDVVVIGAGPGGYTAAIRAAQLGKKVILIEKGDVGGTCLNKGCIPTKTLHASAKLFSRMKNSEQFGILANGLSIDLSAVIDRKIRIVNQLRKGLEYLFKGNGITYVKGEAKLTGDGSVEVTGSGGKTSFKADNVILATGSRIGSLPGLEVDEKHILSGDGILDLRIIPKTLGIVGAGAMGIEIACVFNEIGSKVSVFEMMPGILPLEDAEISKALRDSLVKAGIEIRCGETLKDTSAYEKILISVGRKLNTEIFDGTGLKMEKGKVLVNEKMGTNLKGIYAIGDITGNFMFAHTAAMEGIVAAENAAGGNAKMDYTAVPRCIYSDPGVAAVGLTEEQAAKQFGAENIIVGRFQFRANSRSLIENERDGLVKIVSGKDGKVLGCHIVGGFAVEILGEAALAVRNGMNIEDIIKTIHAHPTVYESVQEAAENALKRAISILNT